MSSVVKSLTKTFVVFNFMDKLRSLLTTPLKPNIHFWQHVAYKIKVTTNVASNMLPSAGLHTEIHARGGGKL